MRENTRVHSISLNPPITFLAGLGMFREELRFEYYPAELDVRVAKSGTPNYLNLSPHISAYRLRISDVHSSLGSIKYRGIYRRTWKPIPRSRGHEEPKERANTRAHKQREASGVVREAGLTITSHMRGL